MPFRRKTGYAITRLLCGNPVSCFHTRRGGNVISLQQSIRHCLSSSSFIDYPRPSFVLLQVLSRHINASNAALLFQLGDFFRSECSKWNLVSCPCFLPFQPSAFTFGHCGFGFVFFHGKITSRIFAGFSVERTLRGCFCQEETYVVLKICIVLFVWRRFCFLMGQAGKQNHGKNAG